MKIKMKMEIKMNKNDPSRARTFPAKAKTVTIDVHLPALRKYSEPFTAEHPHKASKSQSVKGI